MKISIINLSKIIYCPLNKQYQVIFNTSNNIKYFNVYFNNIIAKQIAMASEGIVSVQHSQYELFLTLLDSLKMKVAKIVISKNVNNFISNIKLIDSQKNEIQIYGNISDGIILALRTFSEIYISDSLLVNSEDLSGNNIEELTIDNNMNELKENSRMKVLEFALTESIKKENYESAAFLRDRIKELKSK